MHARKLLKLLSVVLPLGALFLFSAVFAAERPETVEIGFEELSPKGEAGGYAIPASGSSYTCTLTATSDPSTQGENVTLTWSGGINPMTVTRNGVNLGSQSSGWTDTGASALSAGTYTYAVSGTQAGSHPLCVAVGGKGGGYTDCSGAYGYDNYTNTYSCSQDVPVLANPTNLQGSCVNGQINLSWTAPSGATFYYLRVNNETNGWTPACTSDNPEPSGDVCTTGSFNQTSYSYTGQLGATYSWWIHAGYPSGNTNPPASGTFSCPNPQPDLTASNITLASGSLVAGTPVSFRGTVANGGATSTVSNFNNLFYWRYGTTGSFVPFTSTIPVTGGLPVGSSTVLTSQTSSFTPGTIYIQLCADSGNAVAESNEANNCVSQAFNMSTSSAPVVQSCSASPNPAEVGQTVTWTATVTGGTAPLTYQWTGSEGLSGTLDVNEVTKVYTSEGTKNATVLVTDANGVSSGAFACDALTVTNDNNNNLTSPSVDLTGRVVGDSTWLDNVTLDTGEELELEWSSTNADRCIGDTYFSTGSGQPTSGTQSTVSEPLPVSRVYRVTCYNDTYDTDAQDTLTATVGASAGDPTITTNTPRVRQGDSADLIWDTGFNEGCVISGTNGDSFVVGTTTGTVASGDINGETTFTIQCLTGNPASVIVRILPVFEEI